MPSIRATIVMAATIACALTARAHPELVAVPSGCGESTDEYAQGRRISARENTAGSCDFKMNN